MMCYSAAKRLVDQKQTTWEELEERGLCLRKGDPFLDAFNKKE